MLGRGQVQVLAQGVCPHDAGALGEAEMPTVPISLPPGARPGFLQWPGRREPSGLPLSPPGCNLPGPAEPSVETVLRAWPIARSRVGGASQVPASPRHLGS